MTCSMFLVPQSGGMLSIFQRRLGVSLVYHTAFPRCAKGPLQIKATADFLVISHGLSPNAFTL